jgi:DNA-directed RNA polymerase specialized sigma24 family protein
VVELRVFAGLTAEEVAELLDLSLRTVKRDWHKARLVLHRFMQPGDDADALP